MPRPIDTALSRHIDTWVGVTLCALLYVCSRLRARLGGPVQPPLRATTPPIPGEAPPRPERVLAIKLYGLGNVTMLLPVLGALRRELPGTEVDFLTLEQNRDLLERSGVVDRVIGVRAESFIGVASSLWRALLALRRRRYGVILDFEQFIKLSSILAYTSGAPERIGFDTDRQRRGWLYTRRVGYSDGEHMRSIFMRILRPLGIDSPLRKPELRVEAEESARVAELLAVGGIAADRFPVVAVHTGSGPIELKRWPIDRFARVCDGLIERHGAAVVFTGKGEAEHALVRRAMAAMSREAVDLCDQLGVGELVALLRSCHLLVTNDTSVMHLAAAVDTPVAAIFGPTHPLNYGPGNPDDLVFYRDLFCSPCLTNYNLKVSHCADAVCMRTISPEEVLEGIEKRFLGADAPLRARLEGAG